MVDCVRYKIDSNSTGLSFTEEVCPKQLPTLADDGYDPTWYGLEPNEYGDFGPEVSLTARQPIKANRQNRKGKPTDLDASANWNQDFTHSNTNRLMEGFFFARYHEKPSTLPYHDDRIDVVSAATSNDRYTIGNGGFERGFRVNHLVKVSGCGVAGNNGLKLIDEIGDEYIGVAENLTDETLTDEAVIAVVGYQFGAAAASVAVSGGIATLTMAATPVAADAVLTIATGQNAAADDTVTIDGVVYTFKVAAAAAYQVTIGADADATLANLAATINGTNLLTPIAHPSVTATANEDETMTITARIAGLVGNGIATAEAGDDLSWDGATAGGTGYSWYVLGAVVGEWIYVGGDAAGSFFANNRGFARIGSITDELLVLDKTTWAVEAEAATGISLRVFTGDYLRNEPDADDIVKLSYQFERTLGQDDDGTMAEYGIGSVANEVTFNIDTADKLTVDLGFISADFETRTGAEGRKAGTHVEAPNEDFYNTSSDVVRFRMSVIDPADSFPDSLFGYITEGNFVINNGVTPQKAVGVFGALDQNFGNFTVSGEVTALFSSVLAQRAIRLSEDVTVDMIFAADNAGYVFDIPLLGLGNGVLEITLNEPIMLPLELMAGESDAGHTMSYTTFNYLPTAAMPSA